jgi:hypothetical protein
MVAMWVAFAATADPSTPTTKWLRFNPAADGPYVRLNVASDGGITNESSGFRREACTFWGQWYERELQPTPALHRPVRARALRF